MVLSIYENTLQSGLRCVAKMRKGERLFLPSRNQYTTFFSFVNRGLSSFFAFSKKFFSYALKPWLSIIRKTWQTAQFAVQ